MTSKNESTVHPFESAGLGIAPFSYVGTSHKVGPIAMGNGVTVGSPGQPMGTCEYCGQGIAYCCSIESSDGNRFIVGSDCVEKTYGKGTPIVSTVQRDRRVAERNARKSREATRIAEGIEWAAENSDALGAIPNPQRDGETLADKFAWFMAHAGNTGKLRIIKQAKAAVDGQ